MSIRLPLLIYGAKVDLTESIKMADFITLVDEESWQEFMPKTVDKPLFRKLLKYYDEDVVSGAGLRIRRMAKAADELPPTERMKRIAEIFSHFRNPDKETVLTPWRVVNLHLSSMVGGYSFLNEQFDSQEVLEEPRLVDQGQVTEDIFLNPEARILEMNSKSGLYPLYMAYSLYAMKLPGPEDKLPLEQTQALWQETVEQQILFCARPGWQKASPGGRWWAIRIGQSTPPTFRTCWNGWKTTRSVWQRSCSEPIHGERRDSP